jgi:hypothetical protein
MNKIILILILTLPTLVFAKNSKHSINPLAPPETKQYAPLLGNWEITDFSLDKEGKWQPGSGADWNWYTILDGQAIQDDWIQPSLNEKVELGKRQYGTNIRIYNPKKKKWDQIWTSSGSKKFDQFTAVEKDGAIIMRGFYAGNESRITFFNIQTNSFEWKMEFQSKENKSIWKEVYRIQGKRK